MIESITIDNFGPIKHAEVKLSPVTVLIGANNSGKTAFLEAIRQQCLDAVYIYDLVCTHHKYMSDNNSVISQTKNIFPNVIFPHFSDQSLGVKSIMTLLSIYYMDRPKIILIEHPECHIHPRKMDVVHDIICDIAYGENPSQVIFTTHSPYLLDSFKENPEAVIIVDRNDSGTSFTPLTKYAYLLEGDELSLGEIWYSGLIGGV